MVHDSSHDLRRWITLVEAKEAEAAIQWTMPNLRFEWEEITDPHQHHDIRLVYNEQFPSFGSFTNKSKRYGKREQIDAWHPDNSNDTVEGIETEKLNRVRQQYNAGTVEMPLIVCVRHHCILIGGNTRLNVGRELGIPVYGWVIRV